MKAIDFTLILIAIGATAFLVHTYIHLNLAVLGSILERAFAL